LPPDICIEMSLWDRFKWGPEQTERISYWKMKEIFTVLEQQRVTRDYIDNMGPPSEERYEQLMLERQAKKDAQHKGGQT